MVKFFEHKSKINQQGAALVISLLILSLTMVSATALGRIILGELRITLNTTNSAVAFYAADSGIEKALYYLKYSQARGSTGFLDSLEKETFNIIAPSSSFYYQDINTSTPGFTFYNITTSTPAHVDIVDPVGNLPGVEGINWGPNPAATYYYQVKWSVKDCFPSHASDRLEITNYYFDNDPFDVSVSKDLVVCNCSFDIDPDVRNACDSSLTTRTISDNKFYRFSFRPIDSTVESLIFEVYADPIGLGATQLATSTSNIYIETDGNYKNIKYRMSVEIPALAPASDIFSYVVFSEEILRKN